MNYTFTDFYASINAMYIMAGIVAVGMYLMIISNKLDKKNKKDKK